MFILFEVVGLKKNLSSTRFYLLRYNQQRPYDMTTQKVNVPDFPDALQWLETINNQDVQYTFYPNWLFSLSGGLLSDKGQSEDMETLTRQLWASTKPRSALQDFEIESRFWLLLDRISDIICNGLKYVFFLSFSFLFLFLHAGSRWVLLLLCQKGYSVGKSPVYTHIYIHI